MPFILADIGPSHMSTSNKVAAIAISFVIYLITLGFFLFGARSLVAAGVAIREGASAASSPVVGLIVIGLAALIAAWFFRQLAAISWSHRKTSAR